MSSGNINLNALLEEFETSRGIEKVASETKAPLGVSDDLKAILEKKAEVDLIKQAQVDGERVAKELLAKFASSNIVIQENASSVANADATITPTSGGTVDESLKDTISKQVSLGAQGEDQVDPILDKQANINESEEMKKTNDILTKIAEIVGAADAGNVSGAASPNLAQANTVAQVATDDAKVQGTPGTEGTVNTVLQSIVAKFQANGAGSENIADGQIAAEAANYANDEIEKAAAVAYLTEAGVDFDSAVSMVKEAEYSLEKEAAFEALTEAGVDFDRAVELIKEASSQLPMTMAQPKPGFKDMFKGKGRLAAKVVGSLVGGAAAYAGAKKLFPDREKQAALNELIEAGIDYNQAIDLIKQAESEL